MEYLYKTPLYMTRGTHYGNNYWIFFSRKVKRRVTAFSNLEYENLVSLEMNSDVVHYCEQPCKQTVNVEGERLSTVFDVYVVYKDGREEFQEIKYDEELASDTEKGERSRKQINLQRYWCLQNNFAYVVRTDKDIEVGIHTVRNLMYLCAKARRYSEIDDIKDVPFIQLLKERKTVTIGQLLVSGIITHRTGLDYLADLYYRGVICFTNFDTEPITLSTEVVLNGM